MAYLNGTFQIKTLVDAQSLRAVQLEIAEATKGSAEEALRRIGEKGAGLLSQMEAARGHPFLARQWTSQVSDGAGGLMVEIFSKAEDMTFYAESGYPRRPNSAYPIDGRALMAILEEGAPRHDIMPRSPDGHLVFEVEEGVKTSDFGGTKLTRKGGLQEFSFSGGGNTTIGPVYVDHPGFPGNRFIATTRLLIEQGLALEGENIVRGIIARLK